MSKTPKNGRVPGEPPGRTKLIAAMRHLLKDRDFNSITTAEIATAAATNEALIYRYFGSKRGLLHETITGYLKDMMDEIQVACEDIGDPIERLQEIISRTLETYARSRVFAKIVLIEARCFPGYFESEAYQLVKKYARLYLDAIKQAVERGQFRSDIEPARVRDALLGSIEQVVIPAVVFGRNLDPAAQTANICEIVFNGILVGRNGAPWQHKEVETTAR